MGGRAKLTQEQFVTRATARHCGKYDYTKAVYNTGEHYVTISCPLHGDFHQRAGKHMSGDGCPECKRDSIGASQRMSIEEVRTRLLAKFGHTLDYTMFTEYKNNLTKYQFRCVKHAHTFYGQIDKMLTTGRGSGCNECARESKAKKRRLTTSKFIERARGRFGDLYSYGLAIYYQHDVEVVITCRIHGDFYVEPDAHLNAGQGCPECSNRWSKGEQAVAAKLSSLGIEFVRDKSLIGDKKRYDFILEREQVLIEYDGIQHYEPIAFKSEADDEAEALFRDNQLRDAFKNRWAIDNGYALYRIPYFVSLEDACQLIIREVFSVTTHDECEPGRGVLKVFLPPDGDGETLYEVFTEVPELEEPALAAD